MKPGPQWYSERNLHNPRILGLAKRVRVEVDDEAAKIYFSDHKMVSTVEVLTKEGERFVVRKDCAKSDPENPFTRDELVEEFQTLATQVLLGLVQAIDTVKDLSRMANYLSQ